MSYTTAGLPLQPSHHVTARPSQRPVMSATLSGSPPGASPGTSCCQTGRPVMTDPMTGQTVCSCQLTPSLAAVSYPRLASLPESLYGSAAAYSAQALYAAAAASNGAADASSMYSPFTPMSPYELKDAAEVYRGLAQQTPTGLLAYDPTAMFTYPFGAGYGGMDLSAARRNKNATRETTSTLKAWLYEHRKNPYPTKGEKIMLAIITKMTLTQVSTWFANARRRLKKDNKMTWTPKNGSGAESDNDDDDTNNNDNRDGDDKELDVGSTSDNANHDTDHRLLDDSRDSIDIDTLSDKDPSESLRANDGVDDASRLRTSTPDGEHHQNSMDHHHHHHQPHHFSSHPHHHHHPTNSNTTSADHHHSQQQHQQRTDHNKSPVHGGGGGGGGLGPRVHPYTTPVSSMAALQRTPGPYHLPYPTSMAPHRMALPGAMTSATELPGLRPSHAFSSPSSSSFSSPTTTSNTRSTSPGETSTTSSSTSTTTKDSINNNNTLKPKIWSLADIVTPSSSSNSSSAPVVTSSSSQTQGKTPPVRPSPGGVPMSHTSALGSLRAWTEATGGPYGLAAAMAAAQGLPHPYSRGPPPPHGVAGIPTMPGGFPGLPGGIPGGLSLMPHQNGFYPPRPADRLNVSDGFRSDSPTSSEDNKTAFKPVTKSKPAAEVHA